MDLGAGWCVEFAKFLSYHGQSSVPVYHVNVDQAVFDLGATIGIRGVELRASSRNISQALDLQQLRQWVFEAPTPNKGLNIARDLYIDKLLRVPFELCF